MPECESECEDEMQCNSNTSFDSNLSTTSQSQARARDAALSAAAHEAAEDLFESVSRWPTARQAAQQRGETCLHDEIQDAVDEYIESCRRASATESSTLVNSASPIETCSTTSTDAAAAASTASAAAAAALASKRRLAEVNRLRRDADRPRVCRRESKFIQQQYGLGQRRRKRATQQQISKMRNAIVNDQQSSQQVDESQSHESHANASLSTTQMQDDESGSNKAESIASSSRSTTPTAAAADSAPIEPQSATTATAQQSTTTTAAAANANNDDEVFEIERIVDRFLDLDSVVWYKIRWRGYGPDHDSWQRHQDCVGCEAAILKYKKTHSKQWNSQQWELRKRKMAAEAARVAAEKKQRAEQLKLERQHEKERLQRSEAQAQKLARQQANAAATNRRIEQDGLQSSSMNFNSSQSSVINAAQSQVQIQDSNLLLSSANASNQTPMPAGGRRTFHIHSLPKSPVKHVTTHDVLQSDLAQFASAAPIRAPCVLTAQAVQNAALLALSYNQSTLPPVLTNLNRNDSLSQQFASTHDWESQHQSVNWNLPVPSTATLQAMQLDPLASARPTTHSSAVAGSDAQLIDDDSDLSEPEELMTASLMRTCLNELDVAELLCERALQLGLTNVQTYKLTNLPTYRLMCPLRYSCGPFVDRFWTGDYRPEQFTPQMISQAIAQGNSQLIAQAFNLLNYNPSAQAKTNAASSPSALVREPALASAPVFATAPVFASTVPYRRKRKYRPCKLRILLNGKQIRRIRSRVPIHFNIRKRNQTSQQQAQQLQQQIESVVQQPPQPLQHQQQQSGLQYPPVRMAADPSDVSAIAHLFPPNYFDTPDTTQPLNSDPQLPLSNAAIGPQLQPPVLTAPQPDHPMLQSSIGTGQVQPQGSLLDQLLQAEAESYTRQAAAAQRAAASAPLADLSVPSIAPPKEVSPIAHLFPQLIPTRAAPSQSANESTASLHPRSQLPSTSIDLSSQASLVDQLLQAETAQLFARARIASFQMQLAQNSAHRTAAAPELSAAAPARTLVVDDLSCISLPVPNLSASLASSFAPPVLPGLSPSSLKSTHDVTSIRTEQQVISPSALPFPILQKRIDSLDSAPLAITTAATNSVLLAPDQSTTPIVATNSAAVPMLNAPQS